MNKRTALVVGGSRGIGRAIALRLAHTGLDIWLTYKDNHEAAEETAALIRMAGASCDLAAFDVSDHSAVLSALGPRAEENPPYAVIFCAGVTRDNLLMWMSPEEWNTVIRTDLDGFYNVTRAVLFPMLTMKEGRIVAIASASGQAGREGQVNYSAAKAGLIGAVKALAREVGKKGIIVNAVAPGYIETDLTQGVPSEKTLPLIPMGRIGRAEDVAAAVAFLVTEPDMYVHGQVIGVNGGLIT